MRSGGFYPDDTSTAFTGIATTPPDAPVNVNGNYILQYSQSAPPGFAFLGIRLNGGSGANAQSVYDSNSVVSTSLYANSYGLLLGTTGGADGTLVRNNSFELLGYASAGSSSNGVLASNNRIVNCINVGPVRLQP
jgi:hypothetical protein